MNCPCAACLCTDYVMYCQPVMSLKRVDVTLSSDSDDERPPSTTKMSATLAGDGDAKSGKRQPSASPVKTQLVLRVFSSLDRCLTTCVFSVALVVYSQSIFIMPEGSSEERNKLLK